MVTTYNPSAWKVGTGNLHVSWLTLLPEIGQAWVQWGSLTQLIRKTSHVIFGLTHRWEVRGLGREDFRLQEEINITHITYKLPKTTCVLTDSTGNPLSFPEQRLFGKPMVLIWWATCMVFAGMQTPKAFPFPNVAWRWHLISESRTFIVLHVHSCHLRVRQLCTEIQNSLPEHKRETENPAPTTGTWDHFRSFGSHLSSVWYNDRVTWGPPGTATELPGWAQVICLP